jgi:hypothetical protein
MCVSHHRCISRSATIRSPFVSLIRAKTSQKSQCRPFMTARTVVFRPPSIVWTLAPCSKRTRLATQRIHRMSLQKLVTSPINRRLCCLIAICTPTVGDGRRTVGATDIVP